jgi:ligand-binding SRPBCC domain-containing protein
MFEWSHSVVSTAVPELVWPWYADVARWLQWDSGLLDATLEGEFATGSAGTLEVEGQPPLAFVLTEVVAGELFTDVTEIPGVATLTFVHRLTAVPEGTLITHEVRIEGPAADALGPMVTSDTPEAMECLARLASS